MYVRRWPFMETDLLIKCDDERAIDAAIEASLQARREIERTIIRFPEFRWSLEPVRLEGKQPYVIELMLRAGELAGVGPFAAVAGAISQVAAEAAQRAGAKNVIVENGGDIAIAGNREFRVGVFAGEAEASGRIGFLIRPEELPLGICTSSGTVGHSISFGKADAVVVVAREASVADAAATSIANAVRGDDVELSIECGLEQAKRIREIKSCLIIKEKKLGMWGTLPELISISQDSKDIHTIFERYLNYEPNLEGILY